METGNRFDAESPDLRQGLSLSSSFGNRSPGCESGDSGRLGKTAQDDHPAAAAQLNSRSIEIIAAGKAADSMTAAESATTPRLV
ncbi:MAG: hypothetical protein RLZZ440_1245 [Planctomycetota bacterium]|jgi:hypothetical protein